MTTTPAAPPPPTTPTATITPSAWNELLAEEQTAIHAIIAHANTSGMGTSEFWLTLLSPPATFGATLAGSWLATKGLGNFSAIFSPIAASIAAAGSAWAAKEYSSARSILKADLIALRAKLGI